MSKQVKLTKNGSNFYLKVTHSKTNLHFVLNDNNESVTIILKPTTIEMLINKFNKLKGK